jgi:hypothetical protein
MTLKSISKGAVPVMAGVLAAGLLIRYFGDQPILKDAKEGLKGNVVGLFK